LGTPGTRFPNRFIRVTAVADSSCSPSQAVTGLVFFASRIRSARSRGRALRDTVRLRYDSSHSNRGRLFGWGFIQQLDYRITQGRGLDLNSSSSSSHYREPTESLAVSITLGKRSKGHTGGVR